MDIQGEDSPTELKGASKVFAQRRADSTWQIEGVPGFITTTHRDDCLLCEQYVKHAVAASEKLMTEIPSRRIELAFRTAFPRVVERIEDDVVDEAHRKLTWYRNRYDDAVQNAKSLKDQLDSEKERHCKAEEELKTLRKEGKGKQKETSAQETREWREWESTTDSEMAEKTLSKSSRKRRCRDTGPPDVEPGGLTELPDAEPIKLGPHTVLPPVGSETQATTEPAATTEAVRVEDPPKGGQRKAEGNFCSGNTRMA